MFHTLLLLTIGLTNSLLIQHNVVFQKVNEITTTRSRWLLTFVIDLEPYERIITKLGQDFDNAQKAFTSLDLLHQSDKPGFLKSKEFFEGILAEVGKEINALKSSFGHVHDTFVAIKRLQSRKERSLLPFVGSALSFLFGTVSKLTHVVCESLTLINTTRTAVLENRIAINNLLDQIKLMETRMAQANDVVLQETLKLSMFTRAYIKMDRLTAELTDFMHKAITDIEKLQMQLNMLSLGHLSPSMINPTDFRKILIEIKSHLPFHLTLPSDPETNLWDFYNVLKCRTVLDGNRIYAIVSLPLLDANSKFEVFRAHSLPVPLNTSLNQENVGMVAKYQTDASAIAINGARTKFTLMNNHELQQCSNTLHPFCQLHSPIYPINLSQNCLVALFLNKSETIRHNCQTIVKPSSTLPVATYLFSGTWITSTIKTLLFSVACENSKLRHSTLTVKLPLGVINVPTSCNAFNDLLYLSAFYQKDSKYEIVDPYHDLERSLNQSFNLWEPLIKDVPSFNMTKLSKHLKSLKEIPLDSLIDQLNMQSYVDDDVETRFPLWGYLLIGIGFIALVAIALYIVCKFNYAKKLLAKLNGSKLSVNSPAGGRVTFSNTLGETDVMQTPPAPLLTID